mgnify:CR=1 FL=1|tara:strand:+ start:1643 stop:2098 length:456 start_codon:yes stop_codon:yes gene_type:complete
MPWTKEEKAAYLREWRQTPDGIKSGRINKWKRRGIISNDWDATYKRFMNTLNCENPECNVLLTTDPYLTITTKCLDHDHYIINESNVRAVLCQQCNVNDRTNNTSGVPNINKNGNIWRYKRTMSGVLHVEYFKTFEEACDYKILYESTMRD